MEHGAWGMGKKKRGRVGDGEKGMGKKSGTRRGLPVANPIPGRTLKDIAVRIKRYAGFAPGF